MVSNQVFLQNFTIVYFNLDKIKNFTFFVTVLQFFFFFLGEGGKGKVKERRAVEKKRKEGNSILPQKKKQICSVHFDKSSFLFRFRFFFSNVFSFFNIFLLKIQLLYL